MKSKTCMDKPMAEMFESMMKQCCENMDNEEINETEKCCDEKGSKKTKRSSRFEKMSSMMQAMCGDSKKNETSTKDSKE